MKFTTTSCVAILIAASFGGASLSAQADPWLIESTYPFAASQAVASDPTGDIIYSAFGSGFMALNGSADQPVPMTGSGTFDYRARCEGFVRDIKVTQDFLWVAAGVGGLQRWDRSTNEPDFVFDLGEDPPHAWCLDVVHNSSDGSDYAVIGSNDVESGGHVYLVRVTSLGVVTLLDSIDLGTPVYAVAASFTLSTSTLSVLIGKRCDTATSGCDSLRRYDVPTTGGTAFTFPTSFDPWGISGCATPVMVRDIIIDESGTPDVAFVAASVQGIRAFNLDNGNLTEITAGYWPLAVSGSVRHDSIALYTEGSTRLIVSAAGPKFSEERQFYGPLNQPVGCDLDTDPGSKGIQVYDLGDGALEGRIGVSPGNLPKSPLAVAVRPNGSGHFLIDAACNPRGLAVVEAEFTGGLFEWELSVVGEWNDENSNESERVPGGSFDDVVVVEDPSSSEAFLLATTEGTVLSFAAEDSDPLQNFAGFEEHGCVLFARVSHDISTSLSVMYGDHAFGGGGRDPFLRFYDLSAGADDPVASTGVLYTGSEGYMGFVAPGLDETLWLYLPSPGEPDTAPPPGGCVPDAVNCPNYTPPAGNGGVRVFSVSDTNWNQYEEPDTMDTPLIGTYAPSICCSGAAEHGAIADIYVRASNAAHYLWLNYGPRGMEQGSGLMYVRADWLETDEVGFEFLGKIPFDAASPAAPGRLTYDPARQVLYSSFATNGVAMYDVSYIDAPSEVAEYHWDQPSEGPAITSLQVWPGPENYVYVSLMHAGVGIIDATSASTFEQGFVLGSPFKLPGIANAFADAPVMDDQLYPPGSAVYVADGNGGVHWVQFTVFDAP